MSNNYNSDSQAKSGGAQAPAGKRRNRWVLLILLIAAVIVGAPYGYKAWKDWASSETTDDATMQGDVILISSRVTGVIRDLAVNDYQKVQAGDVLVQLDSTDYQVNLEQAQVSLELAKRQAEAALAGVDLSATLTDAQTLQAQGGLNAAFTSIDIARAAVDAARTAVTASQARLYQAQTHYEQTIRDLERYQALSDQGVIPAQQLDQAQEANKVAEATVSTAQADVALAEARLNQAQLGINTAEAAQTSSQGAMQGAETGTQQTNMRQKQYDAALAQVQLAQSAVDAAQLQLSYTTVVAPSDGHLGRISVEAGQRVTAGQPLTSLVKDEVWVIANFKETQMNRIRLGMPVAVRVDAFPGIVFAAHVDSISPASGATFALLPPDNATGNFTKVIQRIPVKIVFEPGELAGYEDLLAPGMSVMVKVRVD